MSKSTSSLSFSTQSSTSMTSSSADEMSLNSNDLNEISIIHHSTDSVQKLSYHHKRNIEHLKEAFIQNPKPNRKYLF
jgi:hypothetical protein